MVLFFKKDKYRGGKDGEKRESDAAELRRTQPKGTGWRRANYRGRASAKQAKKLTPSKPRGSRLFK
ncbi:MAG: hypothetical protein EGQ31_05290 [Prevotella sp.]|nr:hypothetical protein [Prevotella sp.]